MTIMKKWREISGATAHYVYVTHKYTYCIERAGEGNVNIQNIITIDIYRDNVLLETEMKVLALCFFLVSNYQPESFPMNVKDLYVLIFLKILS